MRFHGQIIGSTGKANILIISIFDFCTGMRKKESTYFRNKVVLITGSSRGIGKTLAWQLGKMGARVVLNGRTPDRLKVLEEEMRLEQVEVKGVLADVTVPDDCERMIREVLDHYGRIDILVNMAGLSMKGEAADLHPDVYRMTMETNYLGAVYPTLAALPHIRVSKGSILFISSVSALMGFSQFSAYCASKMSLTALAESLRLEMTDTGVYIGIIYISFTENEEGKTILDTRSRLVRKKEVYVGKMDYVSREKVARSIIRQLARRRYRVNPSFYGKFLSFMKRFFPRLSFSILHMARRKGII